MPLRDKLRNLVAPFGHPLVDAQCLHEEDIIALRETAKAAWPDHCDWHPLAYPGELSLPIHLLPVTLPVSETVTAALQHLRTGMQKEGFGLATSRITDPVEHRQGHIWIATLAEGKYLPIGQVVLVLEERTHEADAPAPAAESADALRLRENVPQVVVRRWWLHNVWLRPAYRCQRIFRHSVPYLAARHPHFVVRDPWPALARALKEYPDHIADGPVQWF